MGIFKTGHENYREDLEKAQAESAGTPKFSLKVGEEKSFVLLDDTGLRFNQHTESMQKLENNKQFFTGEDYVCLRDGDNPNSRCPLCEVQKNPYMVTVATVKNLSGYRTQQGEMKGVGRKELLILKPKAAKAFDSARRDYMEKVANELLAQNKPACEKNNWKTVEDIISAMTKKGNILKNTIFKSVRTDRQSGSAGSFFIFQRKYREDELTKEDVPFNYEEVFKVLTYDQMLSAVNQFYARNGQNCPYDFVNKVNNSKPEKNNNPTSNEVVSSENGAFTADDIPF